MWPFKPEPTASAEDAQRLVRVLTRCRQLVADSHDSLFSGDNEEQIRGVLDRGIRAAQRGRKLNRRELVELFRAAGALQETAQDNGWDGEYRALAGELTELIERVR